MAIYKPTTNLNNQTIDATKGSYFELDASNGEAVKGWSFKIVDYLNNTIVYESEYLENTNEFMIPPNIMSNGRDYIVTIRIYSEEPESENMFNTTVSRGRILGSTRKLFIMRVPRDEALGKTVENMIEEFYQFFYKEETLEEEIQKYVNLVLSDYSEGIKKLVEEIIKNHNDINTEANIESIKDLRQNEIFENLKYDRFIQVDLNEIEYTERIAGNEIPTTSDYSQRCKISWVTNNLGNDNTYAIIELSDTKITEEDNCFDYTFTDGTKFYLYPISGLHTLNSFYVDPDIVQNLELGDTVVFYPNADDALKAHQAGDTPNTITIKPVYNTPSRIIGLSVDTGEIRIQNSLSFAPRNGYIPRFFENDSATGTYVERKIGKTNTQNKTYHLKKGGRVYKDRPDVKYQTLSGCEIPGRLLEMESSGSNYKILYLFPRLPFHVKGRTNPSETSPDLSFPHVDYNAQITMFGRLSVDASSISPSNVERWYGFSQFEEAIKDTTLTSGLYKMPSSYITTYYGDKIKTGTPTEIKAQIDSYITEESETPGSRKYLCIAYDKYANKRVCYYSTTSTQDLLEFNPVGYTCYRLYDPQTFPTVSYTPKHYDLTKNPPYKFNELVSRFWWDSGTEGGSLPKLKYPIQNTVRKDSYKYGEQLYYDYECLYPKTKLGYSFTPINSKTSRATYATNVYARTPSTFDCFAYTPYYYDRELKNEAGIIPRYKTVKATFVDATVSTVALGGFTYYIRTPKVIQIVDPIFYSDENLTTKITTTIRKKSYIQISPRTSAIHELVNTKGYLWDKPMYQELENTIHGLYAEGRFLMLTSDFIYDMDMNQATKYVNPGFINLHFGTQKYIGFINNILYYSYDLINWEQITLDGYIQKVYHYAGNWLVSTESCTYISKDGINWEKKYPWETVSITHAVDHYYLVNKYEEVYISSDFSTWYQIQIPYANRVTNLSGMAIFYHTTSAWVRFIDVDSNTYYNTTSMNISDVTPILDYGIMGNSYKFATVSNKTTPPFTRGGYIKDYNSETPMSGIYCECDYDNFIPTQSISVLCGEDTYAAGSLTETWHPKSRFQFPRNTWCAGEVLNLKTTKVDKYYTPTPLYSQNPEKSTTKYILLNKKTSFVNNRQDYIYHTPAPMGYIATPITGICENNIQLYYDKELTQPAYTTSNPISYIMIDENVSSTSGLPPINADTTTKDERGPGLDGDTTKGTNAIYYLATPTTGIIPIGTKIYSDINLKNQVGIHNETIAHAEDSDKCDLIEMMHLIVPEALNYPLYDPKKTYSSGDKCVKIRGVMDEDLSEDLYYYPTMLRVYSYTGSSWTLDVNAQAYTILSSGDTHAGSTHGKVYLLDEKSTSDKVWYIGRSAWVKCRVEDGTTYLDPYDTESYYWIDNNYKNLGKVKNIRVQARYKGYGSTGKKYRGLFKDPDLNLPYFYVTAVSLRNEYHMGVLDSDLKEIPSKVDDETRIFMNDGLPFRSVAPSGYGTIERYRYRVPLDSELNLYWTSYIIDGDDLKYIGHDYNANTDGEAIYKTYIAAIDKYKYVLSGRDHYSPLNDLSNHILTIPYDLEVDEVVLDENERILSSKVSINGEVWHPEPEEVLHDASPVNASVNLYKEQQLGGTPIDLEPYNAIISNNNNRLFINDSELLQSDTTNPMQLVFNNKARVKVDLNEGEEKFNKVGSMIMINDYEKYHRDIPTDEFNHITPEIPYQIRTCFKDSAGAKVYARSTPGISIQVQDYFQPNGFNELTSSINYRDVEFKAHVEFKEEEGVHVDTLQYILKTPADEIITSEIYYNNETWLARGLASLNGYTITIIVNGLYSISKIFDVNYVFRQDDIVEYKMIDTCDEDYEHETFLGMLGPCCILKLYGETRHPRIWNISKMDMYNDRYIHKKYVKFDNRYIYCYRLYDYTCANGNHYTYSAVLDQGSSMPGYKTNESEWMQFCSPNEYILFDLEEQEDGTFKAIDSKKLYLSLNGGQITENLGITFNETLSSKGKAIKSNKQYDSGTFTCLAGDFIDGVYVEEINEYKDLLTNNRPKLLRSPKGELWIIAITGSPTFDVNYTSNILQTTVSFQWTEIMDIEDAFVYSIGW